MGVEESEQPMLMLLAEIGGWGRVRAADAHDAGRVLGVGEDLVQLMLMMLAKLGELERSQGS